MNFSIENQSYIYKHCEQLLNQWLKEGTILFEQLTKLLARVSAQHVN